MKKGAVLVAWFTMVVLFIAIFNVPSVEAKSLKKGEKFIANNNRGTISVVSSDEVEFEKGSAIFLGKYTIDGDRVRIVTSMMGTATVEYYKITSEGLVSEQGGGKFFILKLD